MTGCFAESNAEAMSVLAEHASLGAEGKEVLEGILADARGRADEVSGDAKDTANKLVADLEQLLEAMV